MLWSSADASAQNLLQYFLLPFAVLVAVVARAPFPAWMPRALGIAAVALAAVFAVVGLVEEATHRLIFYTPSVQIGNAYSSFFRVTSLFRDPSLYGRHLVLAIAIVLTVAWYRKLGIALATVIVGFLFAGLFFSYSQSSLVALFAVAVFISVVAGDRVVRHRRGRHRRARPRRRRGLRRRQGRGRFDATRDERPLAAHRPDGEGVQAAPARGRRPRLAAAGEPGGVEERRPADALRLAHDAAHRRCRARRRRARALCGAARRRRPRRCCACSGIEQAFGLALAAVFVALFVHSLFYSGFFEDPVTWLVLGVTSSFLAARAPVPSARVTA